MSNTSEQVTNATSQAEFERWQAERRAQGVSDQTGDREQGVDTHIYHRDINLLKTLGWSAAAAAGVGALFTALVFPSFMHGAEAQAKPVAIGEVHVKSGVDTLNYLSDQIQPVTVSLAKSTVVAHPTFTILGSPPFAEAIHQDVLDTTYNFKYTEVDETYNLTTKKLKISFPDGALTVSIKPEAHILNPKSEVDLKTTPNIFKDGFNYEANNNAGVLNIGSDIINGITQSKLNPADVPILSQLAKGDISTKDATDQIAEKAILQAGYGCLPTITESQGFEKNFEDNIRTLAALTFFDVNAPHIEMAKTNLAAFMALPQAERDEKIRTAEVDLPANYKKGIVTTDPQLTKALKKYKATGIIKVTTDKFKCATADGMEITQANGKKVKSTDSKKVTP